MAGKRVEVGGPRLIAELGLTPPPEQAARADSWAAEGRTVLHVVADGRLIGVFAAEDVIRPESAEAVVELHRLGVRVAMITGDSKAVADAVARRLGVDEVAAEVLPADKPPQWQASRRAAIGLRWSATA